MTPRKNLYDKQIQWQKKKSIKFSVKFFPSLQKMNRGSENTSWFDLNIGWWDSTFWFLFSSLGFLFVCLFIGLRGFTFLLVKLKSLSRVWLFATLWTVAHQAPLSMGFSRQEYWSGLPVPSPGNLPDPGIEPKSPGLWADALTSELPGKPTLFS